MFEEKTYKTVLSTLIQAILLVVLFMGYFIEFLLYFLISDSFTFFDLPLGSASIAEFIIFTLLSCFLSIISIIVIRMKKIHNSIEYFVCIIILSLNVIKLIYFIPSISFTNIYLFYTLKQFVPFITNTLPIFFGAMKISEIKYNKYK